MRERGLPDILSNFESFDRERRRLLTEAESRKARKNKVSEEVAALKKQKQDASHLIAEMKPLGAEIQALDEQAKACDEKLQESAGVLVPECSGRKRAGGLELRRTIRKRAAGALRANLILNPKAHWDLGPALGILDFERARRKSPVRVSRFIPASGAKLERALSSRISCSTSTRASTAIRKFCRPFMVNSGEPLRNRPVTEIQG